MDDIQQPDNEKQIETFLPEEPEWDEALLIERRGLPSHYYSPYCDQQQLYMKTKMHKEEEHHDDLLLPVFFKKNSGWFHRWDHK